ncbi:glutaredoxin domain-containing protein, partial [Acinetobacter baumannii]
MTRRRHWLVASRPGVKPACRSKKRPEETAMAHVKMYTTLVCPYCVRAKMLLKQRGV